MIEELKFISDPMSVGRHIAELNATNNAPVRSYVWGLDLSGTLDGAGGVGGLLMVSNHQSPIGTHFVCYDGNGNIAALSAASNGSESARYEYGPFGEPIRITGPAARSNPFRFSTKRTDNTTDFVLYEYRAYSPSLGRWLSRDPILDYGATFWIGDSARAAAVHLFNLLGIPFDPHKQALPYSFVSNDPTGSYDILGSDGTSTPSPEKPAEACCSGDPCKISEFKISADVTKKTWIQASAKYKAENCRDVTLYWWTCTWGYQGKPWRRQDMIDEDFKGSTMVVIYAALKYKSCENKSWVSKSTLSENKCHCIIEGKDAGCNCDLKPSPRFDWPLPEK